MSLESKKRRRLARAAARRTGEAKAPQADAATALAFPPSVLRGVVVAKRYSPAWYNDARVPRWTTRLKRYGGLMMIQAHRERQFEQIETAHRQGKMSQSDLAVLAVEYKWLQHNPLRIMSEAREELFWPRDAA